MANFVRYKDRFFNIDLITHFSEQNNTVVAHFLNREIVTIDRITENLDVQHIIERVLNGQYHNFDNKEVENAE